MTALLKNCNAITVMHYFGKHYSQHWSQCNSDHLQIKSGWSKTVILQCILRTFTLRIKWTALRSMCVPLCGHWSAVGRGDGRWPSHVSLFIRTKAIPHSAPCGRQMKRSNSLCHPLLSLPTCLSTFSFYSIDLTLPTSLAFHHSSPFSSTHI